MNVLGIDPGLVVSGLVLLEERRGRAPKVRFRDSVSNRLKGLSMQDRIEMAIHGCCDTVDDCAYHCELEVIGLEDYTWQGAKRSANSNAFTLSKVVSGIQHRLIAEGHRVQLVNKVAANRSLNLTGKVTKADIKRVVRRFFDCDFKNEHERDAALVALATMRACTVTHSVRKRQKVRGLRGYTQEGKA